MPKCHSVEWDDYRISIKPKGWRRVIGFFPYFSGSDVTFETTVVTKTKEKKSFSFQQIVNRFDGQKMNYIGTAYEYRDPPTRRLKHTYKEYLVTTGEHNIQIAIYDNTKRKGINWKVIANFSILERDKYVPGIIFSLISLFLGSGLTLFIQWLIRQLTSQPRQ